MERMKLVVRYRDGKVIKGYSHNFIAKKTHFHVFPAENPSGNAIEVDMAELKAVLIVRDFNGDCRYEERKEFLKWENPYGRKVEITFEDGEVLVGSTMGYNRNQSCFFISPVDPKSNNIRVCIVLSAVKYIRDLGVAPKSLPDQVYYRNQV